MLLFSRLSHVWILATPWTAVHQASCPSLSHRVCSNSCSLSQWCHPTISSSTTPFSSCPQSFPTSQSFPVSQLFISGGQSIGVSASALVLPINIQGWFPLGLTGWSPSSPRDSQESSLALQLESITFSIRKPILTIFYISVRGPPNFPHMCVSICLPVFKLKKTLPPRFSSNVFEKHASFILKKPPDSGRNLPNVWLGPPSGSESWRRSVLGVHWKGWRWSWNSNTLATSCKELPHWKRPWCWEGLGAGVEGDDRGWDGWMASPTRWTWVWVNSGSWWWTGRPGVLRFMESQKSQTRLSNRTELNWRRWNMIFHKLTEQYKTVYKTVT